MVNDDDIVDDEDNNDDISQEYYVQNISFKVDTITMVMTVQKNTQ